MAVKKPPIALFAKAWWTQSEYNWNQVCNGGLAIGALAIADEAPQIASEVVAQAVASTPIALASYAPDGGWAEGPGYWIYATRYTVALLAALESALGTDFGLSDSPGLRLVVPMLAVLFVVAFFWEATASGFADPSAGNAGFHLYSMLSTCVLLWGAAESLRYFALMRRREKLGLAEPLVTHRFLLWGLGIGAAGVGSAISVTACAITDQHMLAIPWVTLSNSLHGFTAAALMWVAFIPPGFYRRLVESSSQQPAA